MVVLSIQVLSSKTGELTVYTKYKRLMLILGNPTIDKPRSAWEASRLWLTATPDLKIEIYGYE